MTGLIVEETNFRMLERDRALDYVSFQALPSLGCDVSTVDSFSLKEMIDNALDACVDVKPTIDITVKTEDFLTLNVKDNGKGMPFSYVQRITDFQKFYSTKFYYRTPSRGALGHAFKLLLGLPYSLSSEMDVEIPPSPVKIRSRGKEHKIDLSIDALNEKIMAEVNSSDNEVEGTEITLTLPILKEHWGWHKGLIDLVRGYALYNPEANFLLTLEHSSHSTPYKLVYPSIGERKKKFMGRHSIHWYKKSEFIQLVLALIRAIELGSIDREISEPIERITHLLKTLGAPIDRSKIEQLRFRSIDDRVKKSSGSHNLISGI